MKLKTTFILVVLLVSYNYVSGQTNTKPKSTFTYSVGLNCSNFINSEAPHKLYFVDPAFFETNGLGYWPIEVDYESSLLKDINYGLTVGLGLEKFLSSFYSIKIALNYEQKGINLDYRNKESWIAGQNSRLTTVHKEQHFERKIDNNYITMPITVRRYFKRHRAYISGGVYSAFLVKSYVDGRAYQHFSTESEEVVFSYAEGERWLEIKDNKKEFTSNFDVGLSAGSGIVHPIGKNWLINLDVLVNIGLLKVDRKYNNEYEENEISNAVGILTRIKSSNYIGLNSNARNISTSITFGLVKLIGS